MASGQDLLDLMELLNQELQLQTGEENVARGLVALNAAQDAFEGLAALRPKILGSRTGTVTTAANTETTAFPSGLLRVDRKMGNIIDKDALPRYFQPYPEPGRSFKIKTKPFSLSLRMLR